MDEHGCKMKGTHNLLLTKGQNAVQHSFRQQCTVILIGKYGSASGLVGASRPRHVRVTSQVGPSENVKSRE